MKGLRDRQWRPYAAAGALFVTVLTLLTGCSGRASVKSGWGEGAARDQRFSRLLVLGVSPDYTQRCNFEYWLVRDLRSSKLAADASCNYMSKDERITRETVERLVKTLHSDGVLATHLVASNWTSKPGGSSDTRSSASYKYVTSGWDTGVYGTYGVPVDYFQFKALPSIMNAKGAGHIVTRLYETRGASMVYTVDTKVKDVESTQLGLAMATPAIADRLRRAHLIQ